MTGRKIVFFLGAGASRGAGATASVPGGTVDIPVQSEFWETVLRFSGSAGRKRIESFLFKYFAGYRKVPSRVRGISRTRLLSEVDVEEVFTFLSERSRAPSTSRQLKTYADEVWRLLVSAVGATFRRFSPNARTRRIYRALIENHVRSRDAVVSFNYDTIFEGSLPRGCPWHYPCVSKDSDGLRIFKPHGSVDWILSNERRISHAPASVEDPVLVAPTHLKFVRSDGTTVPTEGQPASDGLPTGYLDLFPEIQQIWAEMERQMASAKALVFVGYSFPVADLYFSSVLRSVLASRSTPPHVVVVNPDAVAVSARVKTRFRLPTPTLYFDIEQFVYSSRSRLLAAVGE
jgi:hypothetical protein